MSSSAHGALCALLTCKAQSPFIVFYFLDRIFFFSIVLLFGTHMMILLIEFDW